MFIFACLLYTHTHTHFFTYFLSADINTSDPLAFWHKVPQNQGNLAYSRFSSIYLSIIAPYDISDALKLQSEFRQGRYLCRYSTCSAILIQGTQRSMCHLDFRTPLAEETLCESPPHTPASTAANSSNPD